MPATFCLSLANQPKSSPTRIANHPVPALLVGDELVDLLAQDLHLLNGLLHAEAVLGRVRGPALVVGLVLLVAALLALNLLAHAALLGQADGLEDHLHAARFARAVLLLAVLAEVAPLPVVAGVLVVVVVAHY
jgi:hypothetical protein